MRVEVVAGAIPDDLPGGHLVQNGPNPRWVRPGAGYHPFEGDGMLHSTMLGELQGTAGSRDVRYSNRWVRTAKWLAEDAARMPLACGFVDANVARMAVNVALTAASVTMAAPAILLNSRLDGAGSGTANTSVVAHAGRVLALQEGSPPIAVRLPDLETEGALANAASFTAHPKVCPVTGELVWFNYKPEGLEYGVWDKDGRPVHQTTIPLPRFVLVHDIAITEHHTVVLDCPLLVSPDGILRGDGPARLDKELPMRFGVLPRHGHGGEVEWYDVPGPGKMCFHVMNAYEEPSGELVVVGGAQPELSLLDMNVAFAHCVRLTEWRIDPKSRSVSERVVCDVPGDFPRINELFVGQPFRYGYTAAFDIHGIQGGVVPLFGGILKHDLATGESISWAEAGTLVGEPTFVPRTGRRAVPADEDDGYLLVYAYSEMSEKSEVIVLDARKPESGPVCRLGLPRRVPHGFHVAWVPESRSF